MPISEQKHMLIALCHAIKARRRLIVLIILLVNITTIYISFFAIPPVYKAKAQVLMRQGQHILAPDAAILKSRAVVEQLIIRQNLYALPEYGGGETVAGYQSLSDERQNVIFQSVSNHISFERLGTGRLVEISFHAPNSALAASAANDLAALYQDAVKDIALEETSDALAWISGRIDFLGEEIKKETLNPHMMMTDEEAKLRERLQSVQEAMAETEAALARINVILYGGSEIVVVPPFIRNPLFSDLREKEHVLRSREKDIVNAQGADSNAYAAWRVEFKAFQESLEREIILYANGLEVKREIEQAEIRNYQEQLDNFSGATSGNRHASVEKSVSTTLLANLVEGYLQSLQDLQSKTNPVRLLSKATAPQAPDRPDIMVLVGGVSALGLALGIIMAGLGYLIRGRIENPIDAEMVSGLHVSAVLPLLRGKDSQSVFQQIRQDPSSVLAETMRGLLTFIRLNIVSKTESRARVITVTSTQPDEGKTTFAVWLATIAAQNAQKVLVIDADMRRPSLHKAYEIGNAKGIADYLSDRLPLMDTIYKRHPSNVHVMTSKAIPIHALMLLSGERMESLIRRLKDTYDLIIIDTPSAAVFSDAHVVMRLSDHVFYLIADGQTSKTTFSSGVRGLKGNQHGQISLILNKAKAFNLQRLKGLELGYLNYLQKS